jgi:hypothetical protein
MLMQQGLHVPITSVNVSNVPDVRVIMILQDVRAGSTFNVYKMCGHAATMQRRPY